MVHFLVRSCGVLLRRTLRVSDRRRAPLLLQAADVSSTSTQRGWQTTNRRLVCLIALALGTLSAWTQSLDDLNIQIHGYATQGFLYTTNNNIFTTDSSNGSPAWTEAVLNVGAQPNSKLRVGVQARYFLLGNYGNAITLDWAAADYKVNDRFGLRFGKVKTPSGLFNEIQDIDPSYIWALLPQSVYPLSSRNSFLAHYGGVVYGAVKLGQNAGKLDYRGWSGERAMGPDDGYFTPYQEIGIGYPNGASWTLYGAALHWRTPLPGLMIGISHTQNNRTDAAITGGGGSISGTDPFKFVNSPSYFAQYENGKWMVAGESARLAGKGQFLFAGLPAESFSIDFRVLYGMTSYKLTDKLSAGAYFSQLVDHAAALGTGRYSKDWAVSGRYDFNQFLYAKAEQHFIAGTNSDFDMDLNSGGLKPTTKLTILKVGVNF
jgi:hypothetical protein